MNGYNKDSAFEERRRWITAFNGTMVRIWRERIAMLGAVRTGELYSSVTEIDMNADGRFMAIRLRQGFHTYGLFVDAGTGKETPKGNGGDIGRAKLRQAKPWFNRPYYASVMRLNEFMADNLGHEFSASMSSILTGSAAMP